MNELDKFLSEVQGYAEAIYEHADAANDGISSDCADKIIRAIEEFDSAKFVDDIENAAADEAYEQGKEDTVNERLSELSADISLLHEAICEGRKQDAIDILNELDPHANLRSVKSQNSLFPDRVIA